MAAQHRRGGILPVLAAVGGGLLLSGATAGAWVSAAVRREVAGAELAEEVATAGTEFAPLALALGVAAAILGIALAPARGRLRGGVAVLLTAAGLAGLVDVARGAWMAGAAEGALTGLPGLAALGALLVGSAGALGMRQQRPAPALPARFDVDGGEADDEWRGAVDPREDGE